MTTPHVSSLNTAINAISQTYYDYLNLWFSDIRGFVISVEDDPEVDLRRIREVNKQSNLPENKEHLPYLVVTPNQISPVTTHPELDKYKLIKQQMVNFTEIIWDNGELTFTANGHGLTAGSSIELVGFLPEAYNGNYEVTVATTGGFAVPLATNPGSISRSGQVQKDKRDGNLVKTLFRLVQLNLKAKVYVTNYAQALVVLEYLYCTGTNSLSYEMVNPHLSDTLKGRISLLTPSLAKVYDLESKGTVYQISVPLESNAVATIPLRQEKIILNPILDFYNADPVKGLEQIDMEDSGSYEIKPL